MMQTASARPFIAEMWVRSRPSPCVIIGTQSGTGTGAFCQQVCFLCHCHCTNAPCSSSSRCSRRQKDGQTKPGSLQTKQCCFGYRVDHWAAGCLRIFFFAYNDACQALVCPPPHFSEGTCGCSVPRQQNTFAASSMAGKGGKDFVGNCFLRTVACLQNPF
jgi:hypothetical protein